jgi:hypothetical protein
MVAAGRYFLLVRCSAGEEEDKEVEQPHEKPQHDIVERVRVSVVSSPVMKKKRPMYPMVPMGLIRYPTDRSGRFHRPISPA